MSGDTIAQKIPDIHFDWYARFLPGIIAIGLFFVDVGFPKSLTSDTVSWDLLLGWAFFAYVAGHLVQPLSSDIIKLLERKVVKVDRARYDAAKQAGTHAHLVALASKAYAEAAGMCSAAILVCMSFAFSHTESTFRLVAFAYLLYATHERIRATKSKIAKIPTQEVALQQ